MFQKIEIFPDFCYIFPYCFSDWLQFSGLFKKQLHFAPLCHIIKNDNWIQCLQGGVKVPTGGIVRDRAFLITDAPADPAQLRDQRLQSGWKKMCVKRSLGLPAWARTSLDRFDTWKAWAFRGSE